MLLKKLFSVFLLIVSFSFFQTKVLTFAAGISSSFYIVIWWIDLKSSISSQYVYKVKQNKKSLHYFVCWSSQSCVSVVWSKNATFLMYWNIRQPLKSRHNNFHFFPPQQVLMSVKTQMNFFNGQCLSLCGCQSLKEYRIELMIAAAYCTGCCTHLFKVFELIYQTDQERSYDNLSLCLLLYCQWDIYDWED